MTPQRFALIVGLALVGIGLSLGLFVHVTVEPQAGSFDTQSQSCGAPWVLIGNPHDPVDMSGVLVGGKATDYRTLCTAARQTRGTIALVLVGIGAITFAGSYIRPTSNAPAAALDKATPTI